MSTLSVNSFLPFSREVLAGAVGSGGEGPHSVHENLMHERIWP